MTELHATAIVIHEAGVLIRGASGAGKSALALALIDFAHMRGAFACLVGDDRLRLCATHGRLIARGHPSIAGRIEQRGVGILSIPFVAAAVVRLIVDLVPPPDAPRLPEPAEAPANEDTALLASADWDFRGLDSAALLGVRLPRLVLPCSWAAADLALAILRRFRFAETACDVTAAFLTGCETK